MNSEQPIPDFSPHPFTEWFFIIVIGLPIVAFLIWSIVNPEESYLFGKRWMFQKDPEVSKEGIFIVRTTSTIALIIIFIIFISWLIY